MDVKKVNEKPGGRGMVQCVTGIFTRIEALIHMRGEHDEKDNQVHRKENEKHCARWEDTAVAEPIVPALRAKRSEDSC